MVDGEIFTVNPCRIKGAGNVAAKRIPVLPTPEQIRAIADAIDPRYRTLLLISAWCGLRWGEVIALQRKDIGAGCETISVARAVVHRAGIGDGQNGPGCRIDTPKSGKSRTVKVVPHIRGDIKHHLDTYAGIGADALIFPAENSCHLSDKTFRRHFKAAQEAAGCKDVRIHDLRHFAGTQVTLAGATLRETMDWLGHSTQGASLRYQHSVNNRLDEIAERMSALAETGSKGN